MACLFPGIATPPLGRFGPYAGSVLVAPRFDFRGIREALAHRRELRRFFVHGLHILLCRPAPFPDRRVSVGGVQAGGRLPRIKPPVLERGSKLASPLGGVVQLPQALDETDNGWRPAFQHGHVFAPLNLEGAPLVVPDCLQPGPTGIERAPDEPCISEYVGELRVRVSGQFEQSVGGAAPERFALRARVVQEAQERLWITAGGRGGDADASSLRRLEQERNRLVSSAPGQEIEVGCGRGSVEGVDALIEFLGVLRRGGRFRDFLEAIDVRSELPDPRLDRAVPFSVRNLESADLGPLLRDPIELPPGFPGAIEVPLPSLPKGCIESRHEPEGQAFFLRGLAQVRGDRIDVPGEDPHLAPVVDLALPNQAVDPLPKPVEGPVHEPRHRVDPFPCPRDRIEQALRLRLERGCGGRIGGGHGGSLITSRLFSFLRTTAGTRVGKARSRTARSRSRRNPQSLKSAEPLRTPPCNSESSKNRRIPSASRS